MIPSGMADLKSYFIGYSSVTNQRAGGSLHFWNFLEIPNVLNETPLLNFYM